MADQQVQSPVRTKEQLEMELDTIQKIKTSSEENDKKYALKWTEKILIGFLSAIALSVIAEAVKLYAAWLLNKK